MFSLKVGSEKSTLIFSAFVSGFFALLGIVWGIWTGSLAILFDGAYSFVSLALSLLSVQALKWAESPANKVFNFGRILAEPLVIAIKGLVILLVCIISFVSAVNAILSGGREVAADLAIGFALFSVMCCLLTWAYLKRANHTHQSALLDAEANQWRMDSVLSAAVLIGFMLALGLSKTHYAHLAVYADPILVVMASVYFVSVPLRMTWQAVKELLLVTPSADIRKQVYRELSELNIKASQCKMAKVGSYLLLDVAVEIDAIEQMHGVQLRIEEKLAQLPLEVKIQVLFSPKPHSVGREKYLSHQKKNSLLPAKLIYD